MEKPNLKPCPFCGYEHPTLHYSGTTGTYKIACPNCQTTFCNDCTAGRDRSEKKTVEAWNRRANAVEVVRCKDCKHRGTSYDCPFRRLIFTEAEGYHYEDVTLDDGYCSFGVRKEAGTEV